MSVLLFLILGGIIIYGKFKYGGKFQWTQEEKLRLE
jgi:hypothetical protein